MSGFFFLRARWYPGMPERIDDEAADVYCGRLTGDRAPHLYPYDHSRGRHCALGFHDECDTTGPGGPCMCPCHADVAQHAIPAERAPGTAALAGLHHLPEVTADRVLRIAAPFLASERPEFDAASAISRAYNSPIERRFARDVIGILKKEMP